MIILTSSDVAVIQNLLQKQDSDGAIDFFRLCSADVDCYINGVIQNKRERQECKEKLILLGIARND